MRILYVDQYAGGPSLGMEFRTQYLAREWQAAGHDVGVVTGSFSHLRARQLPPGTGVVDGMRYWALPTPSYGANGPRRFVNILAFHWGLRRAERRLIGWTPDVVIAASTHPLDVRSSLRIARRSGAAMIYEVRDLWPLTPMHLAGMSPRHPMIAWMQREEDHGYQHADLVVSLLPRTEPYMRERGLPEGRWAYLPNGVPDPSVAADAPDALVRLPDRHIEEIASLRTRFPIVLAYAGAQGPANALDRLLDNAGAAARCGIGIVLIGDGPDHDDLVARYGKCPNVLFLPRVQRSAIGAILAQADVGYAGLAPSPLYEYGIGMNKVWDYMAAGLPILEHIDSPHSPTMDAHCGWRADPTIPGSLPAELAAIAATTPRERTDRGANGREFVTSRYTEPLIAAAYLERMQQLRTGRIPSVAMPGGPDRERSPSAADE